MLNLPLESILCQGSIFLLIMVAMFLTFKILNFTDLTVEGSFSLGGGLTVSLINIGLNPWNSLILGGLGGFLAGLLTGLLSAYGRVQPLLASLIVTTGFFSISLKLGGSHQIIKNDNRIFELTSIPEWALLAIFALILFFLIFFLLKTKLGFIIRCVGENPILAKNLSKNTKAYTVFVVATANAMIGLAGALYVQWMGFFSIMGHTGMLITGFFGLMLAEVLQKRFGIALIASAILYPTIFALILELEWNPVWNYALKAIILSGLVLLTNKKLLKSNK